MIRNPILPGFHPDPSIVRVGDEYYLAVSTFEWFPGVLIYRSRDLANWTLAARPLERLSQLNMLGNPDSGGVWAPCLSYSDGLFYLVYTDVKTMKGIWRDMHNYLVTAERVDGEWSDPIYLNSVGHDPSLFHDDDGRKWLVQMKWEYSRGRNRFGGIVLQEYSPEERRLVGESRLIFPGTERGFTEAPHLYKRNGYYYLITAEGGTWYDHCVTLARSRRIEGPYELHPQNPILTSADRPDLALQKAGHADLVETPDGEWYMVHLCGRPLEPRGRCILGRETAIQKVVWKEDDWLYLENGTRHPDVYVPAPGEVGPAEEPPARDHFDGGRLSPGFQTLRVPPDEGTISLTARPGWLRLAGRESLASVHRQSLVARRVQHFRYRAETCLEFEPQSSRQMAGLTAYYNTDNYVYAYVTRDEEAGAVVRLLRCHKGVVEPDEDVGRPIGGAKRVWLRLDADRDRGVFSFSTDGQRWTALQPAVDLGLLSDDAIGGRSFTGTFVGICCQDLSGEGRAADFDYFDYIANAQTGVDEDE